MYGFICKELASFGYVALALDFSDSTTCCYEKPDGTITLLDLNDKLLLKEKRQEDLKVRE